MAGGRRLAQLLIFIVWTQKGPCNYSPLFLQPYKKNKIKYNWVNTHWLFPRPPVWTKKTLWMTQLRWEKDFLETPSGYYIIIYYLSEQWSHCVRELLRSSSICKKSLPKRSVLGHLVRRTNVQLNLEQTSENTSATFYIGL